MRDQIIPITKTDLISLIGTILGLIGTSYTMLEGTTTGAYTVTGTGAAGTFVAGASLKSLDFASGVTSGTVYFVPGYNYEGIKVAGANATIADGSATVKPDGATLYKAALASGEVTITAVTPD